MDNKIVATEIRIYKKTKVWNSMLQQYFQQIIEATLSVHGADLEREESIQELWMFLLKLIPKIKVRKNISAYVYTCMRNQIINIRDAKIRHAHASLDDIAEPSCSNRIIYRDMAKMKGRK